MASDTMLALVMAEATPAIVASDSLEDRCRAAMKAVQHHWMVTDEDIQFKGAVAAVYAASEDADEKERIEVELASLRDLSAMLSGVVVDLDAVTIPPDPIGLRKLWLEVTS